MLDEEIEWVCLMVDGYLPYNPHLHPKDAEGLDWRGARRPTLKDPIWKAYLKLSNANNN